MNITAQGRLRILGLRKCGHANRGNAGVFEADARPANGSMKSKDPKEGNSCLMHSICWWDSEESFGSGWNALRGALEAGGP